MKSVTRAKMDSGPRCNAQPLAYHSDNEIPEGPGLLTGERGEFVIYQKEE